MKRILILVFVFLSLQLNVSAESVSYISDAKLKVKIEKDKTYFYDLKNDGTVENFSLQMGNGEYKISILENIEGVFYLPVSTKTVIQNLKNPNEAFLTSIQNINWNKDSFAVVKAKELTKKLKYNTSKVKAIYKFLLKNYKYEYETYKSGYLPNIDAIFKSHKGMCYDYSSMFAAMLRSIGIPTKLVTGDSKNTKGFHAWNEVYLNKKWVIIDVSYDLQVKTSMIKKKGYRKLNEY